MAMQKKEIWRLAFIKSLPILCSYAFLGIAYGILMEEAGFAWYVSLFASFLVYTGAFQFVLVSLLSGAASLFTVIATALFMNSRQTFYSLSFVKDFSKMGRRKWYMVYTMSDETYAVNCSLDLPEKEKHDVMFLVAIFSRCYWMGGTVAGGLLGELIPFELPGIDFCMTALFLIIFVDQWEQAKSHIPALIGLGSGIVCLALLGTDRFMLPALLLTSFLLVLNERREGGV